jgi:hypothetical protein
MNDNETEHENQEKEMERREAGLRSEGEVQVRSEVTDSPAGREERRARRRRCDYGSVKASERDLELLGLVGEQYAVTVPQLARLIGRRLDTARSLRDRWKRAGWISSGQLSTQAPSFVWLTSRGAATSPFRLWQPNHTLALHIEAVTNVRILLERELRFGEWECEREVARQLAKNHDRGSRGHLPDAVLHRNGERIAIEVELTLKSRSRLEEIDLALGLDYHRVWYFAKPKLLPTLQKIATESSWRDVDICSYPPCAADVFNL